MTDFLEKHKTKLIFLVVVALWFFFVHKNKLLPDVTLNLFTFVALVVYVGYFGSQFVSKEKYKFENTDKIKLENMFDTCTKFVQVDEWILFFVGGVNSLEPLCVPSGDGDTIVCVPKGSYRKVATVYDVHCSPVFCKRGYRGLPVSVQNYILGNGLQDKKFFLGISPSSSFNWKGEIIGSDYVQSLHNQIAEQGAYADKTLSSFDAYVRGYTSLKENLTPETKKFKINLGKKEE